MKRLKITRTRRVASLMGALDDTFWEIATEIFQDSIPFHPQGVADDLHLTRPTTAGESEAHNKQSHVGATALHAPRALVPSRLLGRARAFSTILGPSPLLPHVAAAAATTTMLHCVPKEGRKEGALSLSNGARRRASPLPIEGK